MEAFLELFGDQQILGVTITKWVLLIAAIGFIARKLIQAVKMIGEMYKRFEDRESELQEARKTRAEMKAEIKRLAEIQAENTEKLLHFEQELKYRDKNKIKSDLLGWFHYYTNRNKNPQQAWTEMEAEVFWSNFGDYEALGGNGFMHSDVQPAMNALEVIRMDDPERIASLYASRTN